MPIGEVIVDGVAQVAMEAGGEAIYKRYGWKGCALAIVVIAATVGLAIWYFTS
jgi:hypothetical protein